MFRTHSHDKISIYSLKVHFSFHHAQFNTHTHTLLSDIHTRTQTYIYANSLYLSTSIFRVCMSIESNVSWLYTVRWNTWMLARYILYLYPPLRSRCLCVCKIDVYIRYVCMPFLYSHFAIALVPLYTCLISFIRSHSHSRLICVPWFFFSCVMLLLHVRFFFAPFISHRVSIVDFIDLTCNM